MALRKVIDIISEAEKNSSAVIGFNCLDGATVRAAILGAQKAGKPVLAVQYPGHRAIYSTQAFAAEVRRIAADVDVSVGMHLDHCFEPDIIKEAIDEGFSSVMYDGSLLPLEENIEKTAAMVETVHAAGVAVEGEVGHVGLAAAGEENDALTSVEVAKRFAEETNVDLLAVAIGNAHGVYSGMPQLDFERLKDINAATNVPLVLHGGSGIPREQLRRALKNGINKFNVATDFFAAYYNAIERFHASDAEVKDQLACNDYALAELINYAAAKLAETLG